MNIKHIILRVISVSILFFLLIDACPSGKGKNKSTLSDKNVSNYVFSQLFIDKVHLFFFA